MGIAEALATSSQQDLDDFASFLTADQAERFWAEIAAARS